MEVVEKKSSKGGLLSFFDWGAKSKKNFFPNNNGGELDGIKKVKENHDEHVPRFRLVEYDQNRANLTGKGSGEFNCSSSTSSDDGHRTGAPSVVARLMGLDSMPNVNACELCSIQNMDSRFPRNGYIRGGSLNSRIEGYNTNYRNFSYNQDGFSIDPVIMAPQKMHGRPIERFQTEILPPRSAKTIPITHHKLLSPIKSPRFTPTKNGSYIMEAASKMIDPNHRTAVIERMASHASPSIPSRIRDLKDRMEASQKSLRLQKAKENAVRSNVNCKEAITLNGSVNVPKMKTPLSLGRSSSDSTRSRGKVGQCAEVVKSDVQRREVPASSSIKNFPSSKVYNEAVSKQAVKRSQQGNQRSVGQQRVATGRTPSVLQQNNQKQNDAHCGDSLATKSSASNQQTKKSIPTNVSTRNNKTGRKSAIDDQTRSRKDVTAFDTAKQYSMPKGMKTRQQKGPKNGTDHSEDMMSDMVLVSKDRKSIQCNAVVDGSSRWGLGDNKDRMNVISFTFSSPIKKPVSKSEDTGQVMGGGQPNGECSHNLPNVKMLKLSPQRFNGIGADALGILLDQKLKELTCRIDSSSGAFDESPETSFQDSVLSSKMIRTSSDKYNNMSQYCVVSENSDSATETECTSDDLFPTASRRAQEIEDCYSVNKKNQSSKKFGIEPISVSYAEDAFSNEGACSRNENTCSIQDDNKWWSEFSSLEATNIVTAESYDQAECAVDSLEASNRKLATSYSCSIDTASISWESEYVRDVIGQAELVVNNYLLGRVDSVIDSNLFDHLEDQPNWWVNCADGGNKLERKLLFDCISELTNHRCQQLTTGCCRTWTKWTTLSQQAGPFSNELYKDISRLKRMEELMVGEVVEKDMSSGQGRWVDFDMEASEECIEMETIILSTLVDELVADLLI